MSADCPYRELPGPAPRVAFNRFYALHPEGQRLVRGWFDRAYAARNDEEECFEAFIFAWIAVNGWAACVSGKDDDREYLRALKRSQTLQEQFQDLLTSSGTFSGVAKSFHAFWPIFNAKRIRRAEQQAPSTNDRAAVVRYYIDNDITQYEPMCWQSHHNAGEPVPLDWPHTLAAIYRVRCNLFHGEKSAHSEMDRAIVNAAYKTLIGFFRGAKIL